jgi:hypothetical protein
MARQLEGLRVLQARLRSHWTRVVALERVARGAGAACWYLAHTLEEIGRLLAFLGPGSRVTFYFGPPMRVEPLSEHVIGEMFSVLGEHNEIVICTRSAAEPLVLDAELISGPSELMDYLMRPLAPVEVVWGPWPGVEEPDSLSVVLVDGDGILRPHPH